MFRKAGVEEKINLQRSPNQRSTGSCTRDGLAEQGDGDRREKNARLIARAFGLADQMMDIESRHVDRNLQAHRIDSQSRLLMLPEPAAVYRAICSWAPRRKRQ